MSDTCIQKHFSKITFFATFTRYASDLWLPQQRNWQVEKKKWLVVVVCFCLLSISNNSSVSRDCFSCECDWLNEMPLPSSSLISILTFLVCELMLTWLLYSSYRWMSHYPLSWLRWTHSWLWRSRAIETSLSYQAFCRFSIEETGMKSSCVSAPRNSLPSRFSCLLYCSLILCEWKGGSVDDSRKRDQMRTAGLTRKYSIASRAFLRKGEIDGEKDCMEPKASVSLIRNDCDSLFLFHQESSVKHVPFVICHWVTTREGGNEKKFNERGYSSLWSVFVDVTFALPILLSPSNHSADWREMLHEKCRSWKERPKEEE